MKEYYLDVGKNQIDISREDEIEVVKELSAHRDQLREFIYTLPGVVEVIRDKVAELKSVASVTENFNSNRKGNNKKVKKSVLEKVEYAYKWKDKPRARVALYECKFREEWLLSEIVPEVASDSISRATVYSIVDNIRALENTLVQSALKAAVKIGVDHRGSLSEEDAIQEANLALIDAARRFDPNEGVKFITYAYQKITFRMKQKRASSIGIVKVPVNANKDDYATTWLSLGDEMTVGRRSRSLSEIIADDTASVEDTINQKMVRSYLKDCLNKLLSRDEADVLYFRYLYAARTLTYQEVTELLSRKLTRERIRQIEEKAIEKLKTTEELKELLEFFG